ncbi:DUF2790 domain-containing protein [Pseudomonas petrae]|uniref:DUF2790 domain-containing protein n=1 Tax=Pseudomonas petrae TaxID=2912190 RepID=A0ABS9I929_9PSED|nr:DUF2790 domain-containing protein [Pseudomonas petrae]MCF7530972.1 DUF2790 domain-containing protein [Pseudomonas petrae]MCF7536646.1 DUF2790 domain-containing protein [Pseudomonas petrae]MCF7544257.1 DUF2790 domain-containing protein [Pseudomonas petrae]MCF7554326.1 DUF2790 domain-containing protein [Pseudomonas petrae]
MKNFLFLALALMTSVSVYAQEVTPTPDVVHYNYGMHLDIAHVVNVTPAANVCAPTPVQMTYKDSSGAIHVLEYDVLGGGCTN